MAERTRNGGSTDRELEGRIHALAAGQHGVVSRGQLVEVGMSSAAIGRRSRSGRLTTIHRGVYALGPIQPDLMTEMAAVLAGGPKAVLSHTSALPVWGIRDTRVPGSIHVSVPGSGRGGRSGIRFHRVGELADDERAVIDGIPITSPGRTVVDIASMLGSREIETIVAAAERQRLIRSDELAALPDRYRGRPGMSALRALIREQADFTRSEAERRCLEMLRTAGLPRPHVNVPVGPYELDLLWPDAGVAIEIDGRAHHSSRPRFDGDRRKDLWLRSRGIEVIRLSWRQITRDPMRTAVEVGQVLALARARRDS